MPQISVEVVNLPEQTAAVMAKIGPYEGTGKSLEELFAWVGKRGVEMTGPPFGAYYDDPGKVAPESTRYEVGVPVPGGTASDAEAGVEVKAWGAMQVVKTLYKGPYDKMGPTYGALSAWLFENGYRMAGPAIERYLNSLEAVAPEELLTEVCFVVDKAETATPAVEDEQSSP